ncbi:MAG TPA: hypothetical protein VKV77_00860 [Methylovirgula sp.]|nr:hypothetical protein [Methylovirgula sp.]
MAPKAEPGKKAREDAQKDAAKERLAKALRENLLRRKAQERGRRAATPDKSRG